MFMLKLMLMCILIAEVSAYLPKSGDIDYCSLNIDSERRVQELTETEARMISSLQQVQVLMRHGARTPYTGYKCWRGYNISWSNCEVHVVEGPSIHDLKPLTWQFRKIYDGANNVLGGNCQLGQLLLAGNF